MRSMTTELPGVTCRVITTRQRGSLRHVTDRIQSNAKFACRRWATVSKAHAKKIVPKDTRYLMTQIKTEKHGPMEWELYVDGNVTTETGAFYSVYVEYGTRNMRAQPFFWPSVRLGHSVFMMLMMEVYRKRPAL